MKSMFAWSLVTRLTEDNLSSTLVALAGLDSIRGVFFSRGNTDEGEDNLIGIRAGFTDRVLFIDCFSWR